MIGFFFFQQNDICSEGTSFEFQISVVLFFCKHFHIDDCSINFANDEINMSTKHVFGALFTPQRCTTRFWILHLYYLSCVSCITFTYALKRNFRIFWMKNSKTFWLIIRQRQVNANEYLKTMYIIVSTPSII